MKKVSSLLTVTVRSTIYKIILILIAACAAELGLFYYTYLKYDFSEGYLQDPNLGWELPGQAFGVSWTLESLVKKSNVVIVFLLAFVLICLVLYWAESERKGTNTFYFYNRLTVETKQRIFSLTVYNLFCIGLLVLAQVLTVLGMGHIFVHMAPAEYESVQMYFMAFYKSEFLHCLLPMADIFKWIRNLLIFTAGALEIAAGACRKGRTWSVFLILLMIVFGFVQKTGTFGAMDTIMILASGICIGVNIYKIWLGGQEDDI